MERKLISKKLVITLIQAFIPSIRVDELVNAFILPMQKIYKIVEDIQYKKGQKWIKKNQEHLPENLWRYIRESHPEVATFPLGSIAERSVKRLVGKITGQFTKRKGDKKSAKESFKKLKSRLKKLKKGWLLYNYTSFFIFEIAMLNLRGSSENLKNDLGFLYHFSDNGGIQTLEEEKILRAEVMSQSKHVAELLMISMKEQKHKTLILLTPNVIINAFFKVFQSVPKKPPRWIIKKSSRPFTVLSQKGAIKKIGRKRISNNAKIIIPSGEKANILIGLNQLLGSSENGLHSLLMDLLEIAATVYMADIHIPRNDWFARDLIFYLPVRNPKVWRKYSEYLSRPISFLSGNNVGFEFTKLDEGKSLETKFKVNKKGKKVVSLFSGGLDSFIGVTKLLEDQYKIWLVSHYASNILRGIQNNLVDTLNSKYEGSIEHISVPVHTIRKKAIGIYKLGKAPQQKLVQYTRSFLFLTLATCVAIPNGIDEIRIYENGVVALNPSFSEARFNTKTAHPIFLKYYKELIYKIFKIRLNIFNPFSHLTKGEILNSLNKYWYKYISKTNSCWSYSRVKIWSNQFKIKNFSGMHCGRCIPCIWRRAAIKYAGIENMDDLYLIDNIPGQEKWLNREHLTLIMDLLRYCQNIGKMSTRKLVDFYPDFYDENSPIEERIKMLKKYANREIIPWFRDNNEIIKYYMQNR